MRIVGHGEQISAFTKAWETGRLHHAWLFTGPRGIGKRTFAETAARFVLAGGPSGSALEVPQGDRNVLAFDAGSHPDYRRLERRENDRGKLATEISVGQVREMLPMLAQTPSLSAWRVVVVDSACEMNRAAMNAFLKSLEEPPEKTVFFLVCHSPGRLPATIRSRCRALRFRPLADDDVARILRAEGTVEADVPALVKIADGAPGQALRFAGLEIENLLRRLGDLESADDRQSLDIAVELSQTLGLKNAQPRYEAFLELVPAYLANAAKQGSPAQLAMRLGLWEEARDLAAAALPKSLEAGHTVFALARIVGRLESEPESRRAA